MAKLARPTLFAAVQRHRLFRSLDQLRRRRVIWVAAPPGAGKTTLIASYLDSNKIRGIWYQVDSGASDSATFFYYLGMAAAQLPASKGMAPLPLLTPEYLPDLEGFARRYFRELFDRLPADGALVLDNYQEASLDSPFQIAVQEALFEVPDDVNVIIVSRADPPSQLARLAASDRLALLEWQELRLTVDETREIARLRHAVDEETLVNIHRQTDGWAAGVILMLEQIRRNGLARDVLGSATREAVFNYFASEIFDRAVPENQHILLATALLPRTTVEMAEEMSGNPSAGKLLDYLYRRHLFTDRRVGAELIYQYHALFRDFLLNRLRETRPHSEWKRLAQQAAALLEAKQHPHDALKLLAEIEGWESATRIILREADGLLAQGRWETLRDWIGLLPAAQVDGKPWLLYWRGIALTHFDQARARADLQRALALFETQNDRIGQLLGVSAIIMALIVEEGISPNWDQWIAPLERLIDEADGYPSPAVELTVRSALQLATQFMRPDHPMLWPSVLRVLALMDEEVLDVNRRIRAGIVLLQYFGTTGHVGLARQLIQRMSALIDAPGVTALNQSLALAFSGWCQHVLLCESAQAIPVLDRAQAIAKEHRLMQAQSNINEFQGDAHLHLGRDLVEGEAALERMAAIGFADNSNRLAGYHCSKMRLCEWRGNTRQAKHHAEQCEQAARRNGPAFRVFFFPQVANAFADEGEYERALALVREVGASLGGSCYECFDALLLLGESYVAFRSGEALACHGRLRESLLLAQRDPRRAAYVRWMGPQLSIIFAEALRAGIEIDYVQSLIRQWAVPAPGREVETWPWPIKLYTLGGFDVQVDDRPLEFGRKAPKKAMALLKIVAAAGGKEVPDHRVLDLLWPDSDGDAAYAALVATLHRLRKLLADESAIRQSGGAIALNPQRWWVDAWAFERAIDISARAVPYQTDRLESQLALYRGDFLPQDHGVPWVLPIRERLRTKFIEATESLAAQMEAQRRFDDALRLYRRGFDVDELVEVFYRGAMRCLDHLGRHTEARATYGTLKALLGARLGVSPSSVTEKLYQSLRI